MEEHSFNQPTPPKNNLAVPAAIMIAGALIAGAVIFSNNRNAGNDYADGAGKDQETEETANSLDAIKPVSSSDHIRGNPNAKVKVVEFSDTECPFCKKFHYTMNQIMADYGKSGDVAWIYRHFPLDQLHSKARKEAEAAECAGDLGGESKFWSYLDRLFEVTPSNDGLDPAKLPDIASYTGLDKNEFSECSGSGKFSSRIAADLKDGINIGVRGTPFSVVIAADGKKYPINGALPYESVKAIIDQALAGK